MPRPCVTAAFLLLPGEGRDCQFISAAARLMTSTPRASPSPVLRGLAQTVDVNMSWVSGDEDEQVDGRESHSAMMLKAYLWNRGIPV